VFTPDELAQHKDTALDTALDTAGNTPW